jgi:signal transduction histidine kinase/ligand-binding sensor domain-containing protein
MKIHIYLLIFLLFMMDETPAQSIQPRFNLIMGSNGVSLGKINGITRDRQGIMWFSDQDNHCITRYDGTLMTRFSYDPKSPNALGGGYPECIFADSTGIIWIGFTGMGLDRFDPETNHFTHFKHQPNDSESLANNVVSALLVDHLGNLWVGTDGGLDLLDQKTGKFKHYRNQLNDSTSLSYNEVRAIYEDHEGRLWVGTANQWTNNNKGGLNLFHPETNRFTRYLNDPKNPHSLINNKVRSIFEDSRGNFWVGTGGDGLHTMDRKAGTFERHTYNPAHPDQLSRPPLGDTFDHITFITEDAGGAIWIGTLENGLNRYDTGTKKITHYGNNSDGSGTFRDNSGWWANASKDGLIWISTQEAHLYRVDIFTNYFPGLETGVGGINTFYQEEPDVLWLSTNNGLIRKDIREGTFRRFTNKSTDPGNTRINTIYGIIKDKQGQFLINTLGGIYRFNPNTGIFTQFEVDSGIKFSILNHNGCLLYQDSRSNLWFGTGEALHFLDRGTGKYIRYNNVSIDSSSLRWVPAVFMLEEENGLWMGTYYAGLNRLNRQTGKFRHYLSVAYTSSIYRDFKGIIWVGTGNGLYRYNQQSDTFSIFGGGNAGIKIDNVSSMIGDDQDNLWIASPSGIFRINQRRDQIVRYDRKNGVDPEYLNSYLISYKGKDGKIFFSTPYGYYAFDPGKLRIPTGAGKIEFTDLWLKGIKVSAGPDGPLPESVSRLKEIHLAHDQNIFSIGFTATDYGDPLDKTFYYKLENYEEDWRPSGVEERAYYFNVPPGKYHFSVKAANSMNGAWSEKYISIIIDPPWWSTWWAYSFYILLFLVLTWSIHRIQKSRVIRAEREKTRTRELAQAKEIEKAYGELKTTQAQLIQSEKMASLGELTAGIAHEIQNPLNFVNNFSEVNEELLNEMKEEMGKGNMDQAKNIANEIIVNQQKISRHGGRAGDIVKGMLQHSQASAGQKELTDLNALADEFLKLSYHGFRAKENGFRATIHTDLDKSIEKINIIPQDIGRVLLNLYNNAFYAVAERKKQLQDGYEPTVEVTTKKKDNIIELTVRDNGNGIPPIVVAKIFQPFYTTKPAGQGTGLGLSLSYDIIKAHGGIIKALGREGEGAEFLVQIPLF